MPLSISQIVLSSFAVAALLNSGSAYAADNAAAAAPGNFASVSEDAAPMVITVVTANNRETNLRKTATTIVVQDLDDSKSGSKRR